jgi:pyridoxamine 5'-phosphate oxidase
MSADKPEEVFENRIDEAIDSEPNEPNAMAVATANAEDRPSLRMVLLKAHDENGFVFYTNQQSRKGTDLAENAQAALLFHWKSLCRQVRIEGPVSQVSDAVADAYFATRARDSQLGAWASDQSRPLASRETFEERFDAVKARYDGREVPRPAHWSGYRVFPERIEFWQAREHRLHERRLFTREGDGWIEGLLYP